MNDQPSLEDARNLALQKIGRNLVNVQKLEAMLKHLLAFSQIDGFASQLEELAGRKALSVSRLTMGQVIQEVAVTLFDDSTVEQGQLELSPEIKLSMKMRIEGGREAASAWKGRLSDILKERNELVHQMLTSFDPNSIQACEALGETLDAQRARLIPVYEQIQGILVALKESRDEAHRSLLAQLLGSPIMP